MKINKIKEKIKKYDIKKKIADYDIKEKTREFLLPNTYTNPCLAKIWRQLDLNAIIEVGFLISFIIITGISYLEFDENFRNYPIMILFLVQIIILFVPYTKKLFERTDDDKWFKTPNFEKITVFYLVTKRTYLGHIIFVIIFMTIAIIAPYSVEIVANYDKEVNENIIEGFMDMFNGVVTEERELVDKLVDALFILPWFPLVFLINAMIIKTKLYLDTDFEYYFSYVVIKLIVDCKEGKDISKFLLFKEFLDMYKIYVKTTSRLSLDNIDKIYSKVLANPKKSQNQIYEELLTTYDSEDKYKPLKFLSQLIDEEPIVKKHILSEKIRLWILICFSGMLVIINIINIVREFTPK